MTENTNTPNLPAVPWTPDLPKGVDRVSDLGTLYTLKETANYLGISVKTARRMIDRGDLVGSHQVPMANGKGSQWVVPYSSVIAHENKSKAQAPTSPTDTELASLRDRVSQLENALALQEALATERKHELEQLHLTVRLALSAGEQPKRKRWGRK